MKTSELKNQLKKMGCFKVREGSNHEIWKSPVTGREFTVGRHGNKDVPIGTAENILKAAGLR